MGFRLMILMPKEFLLEGYMTDLARDVENFCTAMDLKKIICFRTLVITPKKFNDAFCYSMGIFQQNLTSPVHACLP